MKRFIFLLVGLIAGLTSQAQIQLKKGDTLSATQTTWVRWGVSSGGRMGQKGANGVFSPFALQSEVSTGGSASSAVAWAQVTTYAAMLNLGTPTVLTTVLVASDEDKAKTNQEYNLWPNGVRTFNGTNDKLVDYTATGSATSDGGGPWANDYSQSYDKVFDGSISTFYRSNNQNPWVGRDLGTAKYLNRIILTPIQSQEATYLNGAQIQYSTDGSTWTNIGSAVSGVTTSNYTTPVIVNFTTTQARYWRVQLTNYGWLAEMQLLLSRS